MRRGPARGGSQLVPVLQREAAPSRARKVREGQGPAYFTLAEMPNGAAGARVTGASGATGHGGRLACARVAASNSPLKAARCANPAARRGVNASGNNMPRGVQLASAADAVRPRTRRQRALRAVRQERGQILKEEGEERPRPPAYVRRAGARALHRLRRTGPGRGPVPGVRPPLVPALGRASRSANPAASLHGHRDRDGR